MEGADYTMMNMLPMPSAEAISMFTSGLMLIVLWTMVWKGIALWKAARNNSVPWFIALLIVNTAGILEILYIYVFSKKSKKDNDGVMTQEEIQQEVTAMKEEE